MPASAQSNEPSISRLLRLLGIAWLLEPDRDLLQRLSLVPSLTDVIDGVDVDRAAISYTRAILQQVPPYASLFLSPDAMLNGPHAEQAQITYARSGFEIQPEWRAGSADHVGVELHFLAHLVELGGESWQSFLREQVLTWAPVCCLAVERVSGDSLYPAVAKETRDVLLSFGRIT